MTNKDTLITAEESALLRAKRLAIEQAGTYVQSTSELKNLELVDDQVKSVAAGVMEVTILEQKREYINNEMVFTVKIKATVTTDKLAEAIAKALKIPKEKPVVAVITILDPELPKKNNASQLDLEKLRYDERLMGPLARVINNKLSSRSLVLETGTVPLENLQRLLRERIE